MRSRAAAGSPRTARRPFRRCGGTPRCCCFVEFAFGGHLVGHAPSWHRWWAIGMVLVRDYDDSTPRSTSSGQAGVRRHQCAPKVLGERNVDRRPHAVTESRSSHMRSISGVVAYRMRAMRFHAESAWRACRSASCPAAVDGKALTTSTSTRCGAWIGSSARYRRA